MYTGVSVTYSQQCCFVATAPTKTNGLFVSCLMLGNGFAQFKTLFSNFTLFKICICRCTEYSYTLVVIFCINLSWLWSSYFESYCFLCRSNIFFLREQQVHFQFKSFCKSLSYIYRFYGLFSILVWLFGWCLETTWGSYSSPVLWNKSGCWLFVF